MGKKIDPELKLTLLELVDERVRRIEVRREDFLELQAVVRKLSEAQVGTERRLSQLTERVDALAGAVEALAQAQARTEAAVQQLAQQVGRLSDHVGFGLEDIAHVVLPGRPT